ncbi:MAG: hypothetical protein AB1489_30590 [Acidobacteriota bacterium]
MYCPKCSQKQISENVNYCSHCGLKLDLVAELLASNGVIVEQKKRLLIPQKEVRFGVKLIFFSIVLVPVFMALSIFADSPIPLLIPFTTFLMGCIWGLYYRIFGEPMFLSKNERSMMLIGQTLHQATPQLSIGGALTDLEGRRVRTAEMVQPPSVTENTTKLLNNK